VRKGIWIVAATLGTRSGAGKIKLRGVMWQDNDSVLALTSITSAPPSGLTGPDREWYEAIKFSISKKTLRPFNFEVRDERTFNVVGFDATGEQAIVENMKTIGSRAARPDCKCWRPPLRSFVPIDFNILPPA
jgi:hypothetical protein